MELSSSGQFMKDFKHGMDAIEDLHRLANPSLSPVISRVHYHLAEIRRKATESLEDHPGLKPLKSKIKEEFKFLIEEAALTIENCQQLVITDNNAKLNLMQWGRLIETVPLAIQLISLFPIKGMMEVNYTNKSLVINSNLKSYHELDKIKAEVYAFSRKLFHLKCLPTFEIVGAHKVQFKFDFSHVDDFTYSIDLNKKRVNLSNIFPDYQIPIQKIEAIDNQTALIMSAKGEFYYFEKLKASTIQTAILNGAKPALFHFPFLFRPLSIIIPREGEIAPLDGFIGTGCEKLLTDQDFGKPSKPVHALDIFSILSK